MHGVSDTPFMKPNAYVGDAGSSHYSCSEAGRTELVPPFPVQFLKQGSSFPSMRGQQSLQPFALQGPSNQLQNNMVNGASVANVHFGHPSQPGRMRSTSELQSSRVAPQNFAATSNSSYDNQSTWEVPGQGVTGQHLGHNQGYLGVNDPQMLQQQGLKTQQKLHQVPQLHTSQQLEHYIQQQEAYLQDSCTSYSALLHGPDTPPSQPEQPGFGEAGNDITHIGATRLLSTKFASQWWPMKGMPCFQGFPGVASGQEANATLQQHFRVDCSLHQDSTRTGGGLPALAYTEKQTVLPESRNCSPQMSLDLQAGRGSPHSHFLRNSQKQSSSSMPSMGLLGNEPTGQHTERNQLFKSFPETNAMSKSQINHGDLQDGQQSSWVPNEENWSAPKHYFPTLKGSVHGMLINGPIEAQNSSQQSVRSSDSIIGKEALNQDPLQYTYQPGNFLQHSGGALIQQQNRTVKIPSKPPMNQNVQQFGSSNHMQSYQFRLDSGHNPRVSNVWPRSTSQQIGHVTVDMSSNRPSIHGCIQQVGCQPRGSTTRWHGNTCILNKTSADALKDLMTRNETDLMEGGKTAKHTYPPCPEAHGNLQGFWKSCTLSNQSSAGPDTIDYPLDKDGHVNISRPQPLLDQSRIGDNQVFNHNIGLGGNGMHQILLSQNRQLHSGNDPVPDRVTGFDGQACRFDAVETIHHERNFELEEPSVKMQKKNAEQDTLGPGISLAHLRPQNQGPLSPQQIKLGLGPPSNAAHIVQQGGKSIWSKISHVQSQNDELPASCKVHVQHSDSKSAAGQIVSQCPAVATDTSLEGEFIQEEPQAGDYSSQSVQLPGATVSSGYVQWKPLAAFFDHGLDVSGSNLKEPIYDTGFREIRSEVYVDSTIQAVQGQLSSLKQDLGVSSSRSMDHIKSSTCVDPKFVSVRERSFNGVVESFSMAQQNAAHTFLRSQVPLRKPIDVVKGNMRLGHASNMAYAGSSQFKPPGNEVLVAHKQPLRSTTTNLQQKPEEQNVSSSCSMNGPALGHLRARDGNGQSQAQLGASFLHSNALIAINTELCGSRMTQFSSQEYNTRQQIDTSMVRAQTVQGRRPTDAVVVNSAIEAGNMDGEQETKFTESMLRPGDFLTNNMANAERTSLGGHQQILLLEAPANEESRHAINYKVSVHALSPKMPVADEYHAGQCPLQKDSVLIGTPAAAINMPCPVVGPHVLASVPLTTVHSRALAMVSDLSQLAPHSSQNLGVPLGVQHSVARDTGSGNARSHFSTMQVRTSQPRISPLKQSLQIAAAIHPKKRKKSAPTLIPWHLAVSQTRGQFPSSSDAEIMWANATNRVVNRDDGVIQNEGSLMIPCAKRRLRSTTQLMQQLFLPLSSSFLHGNTPVDYECATFELAKVTLEDACRIVSCVEKEAQSTADSTNNNTIPSSPGKQGIPSKQAAATKFVERVVQNVKRLNDDVARLDSTLSVAQLKCEVQEVDSLSIVNRLIKYHGTPFQLSSCEIIKESLPSIGPGAQRSSPQKYVTVVPIPKSLPEGVKCLSL